MRKSTLLFLLIGLFSGFTYASIEDLRKLNEEREASMTEEEKAERDRKLAIESFKQDYREEQSIIQALNEAQEEVDAEYQRNNNVKWLDIVEINETTLYYTYSTIAQTLAGAFGILGAFAMFRLQSIGQSLSSVADKIANAKVNSKRESALNLILVPNYAHQDWESFHDAIKGYEKPDDIYSAVSIGFLNDKEIKELIAKMGNTLDFKKRIARKIKCCLINTLATISVSVLLILFIPFIINFMKISFITTITLIGFSVICLYSYYSLVINALDISKHKEI